MVNSDITDKREGIILEHVKNLLRNSVKQIEGTKKQGWRKR